MPEWVIPNTLTNSNPCDADEVMAIFYSARDLINAGLDDENISSSRGLTESGANITMDAVAGHTHDGVDSAGLAFAQDGGTRGAVKYKVVNVTGQARGAWSADLNGGFVTTVLNVFVLWQTFPGGAAPGAPGDVHHIHTAAGLPGAMTVANVFTSRHHGLYNSATLDTGFYLGITPGGAGGDEVYVKNSFLEIGGGGTDVANFRVVIVGVD